MKGHLWWNLERKPLSSEKMDRFLHQTFAKYPFQRLQQRRFQSSLISRVHSKHSKVLENKSDNSPCRYCILELSYQKTCRPACQREINSTHSVPHAARCFSSLRASNTKHATRTQRPPSFIHYINCNELIAHQNTKKLFIAWVEVSRPLVPQFKELSQQRPH